MRITDYNTFVKFISPLVKLHKELQHVWEPELETEEFACRLLEHYVKGGYYYGELDKDTVLYFLAVVNVDSDNPVVWLLHVNRSHRDRSKVIVDGMLNDLRKIGKSQVSFETFNLKSSYERWVRKFGAKKHSINYRINL